MRTLVLASATGLTAIFLLPQIARVLRTGDTSGLSASWAAFGLVTNLSWIVYLGRLGLWPAVMAPALAVVTYGVMLLALIKRAAGREWVWATGGFITLLVIVGSWGGMHALGMLLVLTPVVQLTPAIVASYRERCPTGIAPATWALSAAEALLWGWYGWLVRDIALLGYGLVTGLGSMLILRRWLSTRPRLRTATTGTA
jgi:uncharacterized protein with PQ loop repeat